MLPSLGCVEIEAGQERRYPQTNSSQLLPRGNSAFESMPALKYPIRCHGDHKLVAVGAVEQQLASATPTASTGHRQSYGDHAPSLDVLRGFEDPSDDLVTARTGYSSKPNIFRQGAIKWNAGGGSAMKRGHTSSWILLGSVASDKGTAKSMHVMDTWSSGNSRSRFSKR